MLNSYLSTLHINNSIHTSQYDTDRHKFKSRDNWYLTLQLLDSLLQNSNGIFVHGGVYVPLGGISACKKHFSFWILIETNHLSMCCMCLGRMKGKRMWCSKKWLWIAQKITCTSQYRTNSHKLIYPLQRKHTSEYNSYLYITSTWTDGFILL